MKANARRAVGASAAGAIAWGFACWPAVASATEGAGAETRVRNRPEGDRYFLQLARQLW
jgi:hypothetical protein